MEYKFDYYVRVKAVNTIEGEKEEYDFVTEAYLDGDADDYTLIYYENNNGEFARTVLKVVGGEKVVLKRESEMCTLMTIEADKRNISEIILPFGKITMGVMGVTVESDFHDGKGSLRLRYITYTDKEPLGDMRFTFEFYKKGTPSEGLFL